VSADRSKVPHTLLLADDSVTIQRVIELTFADEDIRVIAVSDGNQAIARIEEQPPDIVLADVGMPGKSGYEVSSYVKHRPGLAHIPVLLLTGAFEPIDQQKAAEAGCDGVLAKPFEPQVVIGRVKELLSRPRTVPPPPATVTAPGPGLPGSVPAGAAPGAPGASNAPSLPAMSTGDYLDELDAAFAKLPGAHANTPATPDGEEGVARSLDGAGSHEPGGIDDRWDITFPSQPLEDLPLLSASSFGSEHPSPSPPAPAATAAPLAPGSRDVIGLPPPPSAPEPSDGSTQALPALAVAFAALLAAEQNPAVPADTTGWAPPLAVSDEIVERVAERVLEQLSDRLVRETVAELVSAVAERLVREEIERIKASIK
jgi:CheY-like chemotaxis protein